MFGNKIQGLHFCHLPNINSTWNQFTSKNMNNSYGGIGDFSHVYVIMHQYFGKKNKMQKINI
jgi:hypothetical protein